MRGSTAGTTSTTGTSGGRGMRSHGRRRTATRRPLPRRGGQRSSPRPVQTTRRGSAASAPYAGRTALIPAPYPDHPSGHLCNDGAHVGVLRMFFGDVIEGGYQITSASTFLAPSDPKKRTFRRLSA